MAKSEQRTDIGREPPGDFVSIPSGIGFSDRLAPLYVSKPDGSPPRIGFFVEPHHCNPAGVCGGGMLASVLDHAVGGAVMYEMKTDVPPATVSLHSDFVAPGRLGQWLETKTVSVSHKGALGYATVVLRGPEGVVAQGSGICKVPRGRSR